MWQHDMRSPQSTPSGVVSPTPVPDGRGSACTFSAVAGRLPSAAAIAGAFKAAGSPTLVVCGPTENYHAVTRSQAPGVPGGIAVEIGSSFGDCTRIAAAAGWTTIGLDISEQGEGRQDFKQPHNTPCGMAAAV